MASRLSPQRLARIAELTSTGLARSTAIRKSRAEELGYASPRAQRRAVATGVGRRRDYKAEYAARKRKAKASGFSSPRQATKGRKLGMQASELEAQRVLRYFGVSAAQVTRYANANSRHYAKTGDPGLGPVFQLDEERNQARENYSETRVGYVLSYYHAVTNESSNFDDLIYTGPYPIRYKRKPKYHKDRLSYLEHYTSLTETEMYITQYYVGQNYRSAIFDDSL